MVRQVADLHHSGAKTPFNCKTIWWGTSKVKNSSEILICLEKSEEIASQTTLETKMKKAM